MSSLPIHTALDTAGLSDNCHPSIEVLGHRGSHIAFRSDTETQIDETTGLPFFRIADVFHDTTSVLLGCGMPNVFTAIYDDEKREWKKFAAFMFWRDGAALVNTKGRLQAGAILELRGLGIEVRARIRHEMEQLVGQRSASCARLNAKVLHQAGFTFGNGRSLRTFTRPSHFASLLWRYGLKHEDQDELVKGRLVLTGDNSIAEHFEGRGADSVWGREIRSGQRLAAKLYSQDQPHVPAPIFPVKDSIPLDPTKWQSSPLTEIGVNRRRRLAVNVGFLIGQQPVYTVKLPGIDQVEELQTPLQAFPGELDRVTKAKKYILFSRPVIATIRFFRERSIERYNGIPARAAVEMLARSANSDYETATLYNFAVTLNGDGTADAWITGLRNQDPRIEKSRWTKIFAWILAKHLMLTGHHPRTSLAGEAWVALAENGKPVMYLNPNSGSYKPSLERLMAFAAYLESLFGIEVKVVPFAA